MQPAVTGARKLADRDDPPPVTGEKHNARPANASAAKQEHSRGQAECEHANLPATGQAVNPEAEALEAERQRYEWAERLWPQVAHQIGEAMGGTPTHGHRETTLQVITHHLRAGRQVTKAALLQGAQDVQGYWGDRPGYPSLTVLSKGLDKAILAAQAPAEALPVSTGREPDPSERHHITRGWSRALFTGDQTAQAQAERAARELYRRAGWSGAALETEVAKALRDAQGGVPRERRLAEIMAQHGSRAAGAVA